MRAVIIEFGRDGRVAGLRVLASSEQNQRAVQEGLERLLLSECGCVPKPSSEPHSIPPVGTVSRQAPHPDRGLLQVSFREADETTLAGANATESEYSP